MFILFNLIFILAFGAITSYTDLTKGKIENKYIALAILFGFLTNLIYSLNTQLMYYPGAQSYLLVFIFNSFFALLVGFVLWWVSFWSAADAKLLFAYSTLIPLEIYSYGYSPFFPSGTLLINTFVPVFLVMLFRLFVGTTKLEKIKILKKIGNFKLIFRLSIVIFGFSWLFVKILSFLNLPWNYFLTILFIFFVLDFLEKKVPFNMMQISIFLAILRIALDFKNLLSFSVLGNFFFLVLLFWFSRYFVLYLGFYANSIPVQIKNLKAHMIPMEMLNAIPKNNKYGKHELFYADLITLFKEEQSFPLFKQIKPFEEMKKLSYIDPKYRLYEFKDVRRGLTKRDIDFLKKLKKQNKLDFDTLRISKTTPFAHLLFFGVLLTFLCRGNAFIFLHSLLG